MERILLHLPHLGVMIKFSLVSLYLPPDEETYCPGPETKDQEENNDLICLDEGSLCWCWTLQGTVVVRERETSLISKTLLLSSPGPKPLAPKPNNPKPRGPTTPPHNF